MATSNSTSIYTNLTDVTRLTGLTHVLDAIQGKAVKSVLMVCAQLSRAGAAGGRTAVVVGLRDRAR
jgi:hypothetical protein